ncbi:hypothetical protein ACFQ2B_35235 [Streptomyces stramineus]
MSSAAEPRNAPVARDFWDRLPFDVRSAEFHADPYPFYERLRAAAGPVTPLPDGALAVTGYQESLALLGDPRFGFGDLPLESASFLMADPPEHRSRRARVAAPFAVRAVERLRPVIRQKTDALLLRAADRAELDVVTDLGVPLALDLICALVGVPLDARSRWYGALSWLAAGFDPDALRAPATGARVEPARVEFAQYLGAVIKERRRSPHDDLVSALLAPSADGSLLTGQQVITAVGQLVVAGYEPVVNMIANGMHALLRHPEQLEHLAGHPAAAPSVVEELLRYDPRSS